MENIEISKNVCIATLSRLFSPTLLTNLSSNQGNKLLTSIIQDSGLLDVHTVDSTIAEYLDIAYAEMSKTYRNEYIYKNTIANKILLGRHSLNTATMHTEFRVGKSKADALILNGTSHIYEIKTELDTLDRIEKQLADYIEFAEYVSVVSSQSHIEKLQSLLPDQVGLIELTKRNTLKTIRKAKSGKAKLNYSKIFDSLLMSEYTAITKKVSGKIPEVSNALMFQECKKIFSSFNIDLYHDLVIKTLKSRNMDTQKRDFILSVPVCLKATAISTRMSNPQRAALLNSLNRKIAECMH